MSDPVLRQRGLDLLERLHGGHAGEAMVAEMRETLLAHVEAAVQAGATREEIVETILPLIFYAGGPAVRNALVAIRGRISEAR